MTIQCKVCASEHVEEIEREAAAGVSLRDISKALNVKYAENISHTAIGKHLYRQKTAGEGAALELAKANEKRIRNLEVNAWISRASGTDWGISTYDIQGSHTYAPKREDVLLRAIPDSELLESEYKAIVAGLKDEIRAEHPNNLDASVWEEARTVRLEWAEEDRKHEEKAAEERAIESAKRDLLEREAQHKLLEKSLEKTAQKIERQQRLQALRDKKLEEDAGIDENGDPIAVT